MGTVYFLDYSADSIEVNNTQQILKSNIFKNCCAIQIFAWNYL